MRTRMHISHNFAHIFYEINRFSIQNPYFYVCDFNGKAPLKRTIRKSYTISNKASYLILTTSKGKHC